VNSKENPSRPGQALNPALRERFLKGIELFNREEFFECHEVLEAAWLEASGTEKTFLQGWIQVAVAFYHLRRSNFAGASRLLRAGVSKLGRCSAYTDITNLEEVLQVLTPLPEQITAGSVDPQLRAPAVHVKEHSSCWCTS
jgi:predicted metal-dependent hydrolase